MSLNRQFMMSVPVLPDDDFLRTFYKIAPHLEFKTAEQLGRFIFDRDERDSLCDRIVDSFEDELDSGQSNMLTEFIDKIFDTFSKTLFTAHHNLSGGVSIPYHHASLSALETILPTLNERMRIACVSFAESVLDSFEDSLRDEPPRPNII